MRNWYSADVATDPLVEYLQQEIERLRGQNERLLAQIIAMADPMALARAASVAPRPERKPSPPKVDDDRLTEAEQRAISLRAADDARPRPLPVDPSAVPAGDPVSRRSIEREFEREL